MKTQLIVALDVPTSDRIAPIVDRLPEAVSWFKVGMELFTSEGPAALAPLRARGKQVFLDLKFHDIPRTVAHGVKSAARHGVGLLTVHASGGEAMLKAAAEAARELGASAPKVIAVTTLTSLDQGDLEQVGVVRALADHTLALGELALSCGIDGLVCSALEIDRFRARIGPEPLLVTPGIRPAGADMDDQKRVATPAMAVNAGSSFLVVGRPIVQAPDPHAAATEVLRQMDEAGGDRGQPLRTDFTSDE